ncbi:MAG: FG-GAP repeat protein [Candidatus Kerfeldbacteria bacterium]|nr:FG-GAP repeat protein [Candidatus Kerfeldbacteria bacterium]
MKKLFAKKNRNSPFAALLFLSLCIFAAPHQADAANNKRLIVGNINGDGTPLIANWNFKWSIDSDEEMQELAQWDLIIADVEQEAYSRERLEKLKKLNPDIILLAYISMTDIRPDAATLDQGTMRRYIGELLDEHPEWILRDRAGKPVHWWEDYSIFNMSNSAPVSDTGERFNTVFPKIIRDAIIKDNLWNGVFYDNLWEDVSFVNTHIDENMDGVAESKSDMDTSWFKGMKKVLIQTRKYAKKYRKNKFIITGNGGMGYYKDVNGVGFEHFPNTKYGQWVDSMQDYNFILQHALPRQYAVINTNTANSGNRTDYKKFRFGLTSTLLNDGYYSFDNGDQSHAERWFYDEYKTWLGTPVSGAYNVLDKNEPRKIQPGLWRRDYEQAIVLVNSMSSAQTIRLESGFEKIQGEQDPVTNSGDVIGQITIPAEDGIILLKRLSTVRDTNFLNGGYAKVFNARGKQVRKSFFAYDGSFTGGAEIHKISKKNYTVVADDTSVRVYNNRNDEIAAFAPYGTGYASGVNVAVGNLYGKKKQYIVTGSAKKSGHVRIYTLKGRLVNSGCFPYGNSYNSGVSVAMGDLNGDGKMEIVTGTGPGGGPQVRVLNRYCEVINPGFLAFSKDLRSGINIAVGDVDGNGKDEIIAAPGAGGGPQVRIFRKSGKLVGGGFFAYKESDHSGIYVSTADVNNDGIDEIMTSTFSIFNLF